MLIIHIYYYYFLTKTIQKLECDKKGFGYQEQGELSEFCAVSEDIYIH